MEDYVILEESDIAAELVPDYDEGGTSDCGECE